jgi:parvulin-like peptidyl-prolyl isomerase
MKIAERIPTTAVAALLVAPLFAASGPSSALAEDLNSIVLRVNDEIATAYDYTERRDARLAAISEAKEMTPDERRRYAAEAPRATMREILDELLLLSRARQLVIEPGPAEIDEAMDATRQRMGIPNDEAFVKALEASKMTLAEYRDRTSRSIKANQVIQREVNPLVIVQDDWLQRYYREHPEEFRVPARARLRALVIPTDKISAEAAQQLAGEIRAALAAGEEMGAAATRLRGDDLDRVVGPVDLGWVEPGELAKELDAVVWALPPGALSAPTQARGGLHLVEVLERVESTMKPYVEVKPEIEGREKEKRRDEALRKYLGDLEKNAYLVEKIPAEAAGFREAEASGDSDPLAAFAPRREAPEQKPPAIESAPERQPASPPH